MAALRASGRQLLYQRSASSSTQQCHTRVYTGYGCQSLKSVFSRRQCRVLKAPSHQASASTDDYVPQHFRRHATSMLSCTNPLLLPMDDIGSSMLDQRYADADTRCEGAFKGTGSQSVVSMCQHTLVG